MDANATIQDSYQTTLPTLVVRCHERELEVYVYTQMQTEVEVNNLDQATIRVRYDKDPAQTLLADKSTSGDSLFFPEARVAIDQFLTHEQLLFGFTPFNSAPVETTFDVRGLGNAVQPLFEACP